MNREAHFVGPIDRLLFLRSLPNISGIGAENVAYVARAAKEVEFGKGDLLLEPGVPITNVYMIVSGRARFEAGDGGWVSCGPGEGIGFLHALAKVDPPRAVAEVDTIVLSFDHRLILELYEEDFSVLQNAIRSIARTQLELMPSVVKGSYRSPWAEGNEPVTIPQRDLDIVERLVLLRRGGAFRNVGLEALALLASSMKQERWEEGARFWEMGGAATHLYVILEGEVECTLEDGSTFRAGPGYPLGNIETLARGNRWYEPVAQSPVRTLRGDHEAFFDVIEDDFDVAVEFTSAMARGTLAAIAKIASQSNEAIEFSAVMKALPQAQ